MSLRRRHDAERGDAEVEDADDGTDAEMDVEREAPREDDDDATEDIRAAEADDAHASEAEEHDSGKKPARKR
jgi:hypothetical protein